MIKYLVMDVDGTLTDGKINIGSNGESFKSFNIKDGYGIHNILIPNNITPIIISGRESDFVIKRCKELGIVEIYQGVSAKLKTLKELCSDLSNVAYIGDDINDLSCMIAVRESGGIVGCPANAVKQVIAHADFVSDNNGGDGAVRDFIEYIIEKNNCF